MVTSPAVGSQLLPTFLPRHRSTFQREQLTAQGAVATLDTSPLGFAELLCSSPHPPENALWRPHQLPSPKRFVSSHGKPQGFQRSFLNGFLLVRAGKEMDYACP